MTFSEAGRYNFASAIAVRIAALSESRMLSRRFCFEGAEWRNRVLHTYYIYVVDSQTILRHGRRNTHHTPTKR